MDGPIKIKPGIVPYIFSCQFDRKRIANHSPCLASEKRRHKAEAANILATRCSSFPHARIKENVTPNILTVSI